LTKENQNKSIPTKTRVIVMIRIYCSR